jgi:hypothetical protein
MVTVIWGSPAKADFLSHLEDHDRYRCCPGGMLHRAHLLSHSVHLGLDSYSQDESLEPNLEAAYPHFLDPLV